MHCCVATQLEIILRECDAIHDKALGLSVTQGVMNRERPDVICTDVDRCAVHFDRQPPKAAYREYQV